STEAVSSPCLASLRAIPIPANATSVCTGCRFTTTARPACIGSFKRLARDPVFTFCATAPLPDGLDEFLLAGYLRKKSVELVKCETNDLEVPANSDFV